MFVQFCCFVCSGKDILDIFNILRHTDKYIKIFLRNYLFICKKLLQPYLFVLYCVMEQYDKIIAICKLASKLFWYSTFYLLSVMHPLSMYLPYSRLWHDIFRKITKSLKQEYKMHKSIFCFIINKCSILYWSFSVFNYFPIIKMISMF